MTTFTKKTLRTMLEKSLAENKADLADHEKIREVLLKHDGKKITARIVWPEGMRLSYRAGMYHVEVARPGRHSDGSHLISYDNMIHADKFDNFDSWAFNGAMERIEQAEKILSDEWFGFVFEWYKLLNKQWAAFSETARHVQENVMLGSYKNPVYYELIRLIGIDSEIMQAIRFKK